MIRIWIPIICFFVLKLEIGVAGNPVITEVMYHAREAGEDGSDYDFIEVANHGAASITLSDYAFTSGIDFAFKKDVLKPGEHAVVVKDRKAFKERYTEASIRIVGEYKGKLSNKGEAVELEHAGSDFKISFTYDDGEGWPVASDGAGHSLVPLVYDHQEEGRLDYGGNWRASAFRDGSPGQKDPKPKADLFINEFVAHSDYVNEERPEYDSNDWIELYNASPKHVSGADWYLSDDADALKKWALPNTDSIRAQKLVSYSEVEGFHDPISQGFGLRKSGEAIFLSYLPGDHRDRVADAVVFKGQENGRSQGRYPDGAPWWCLQYPTRDKPNQPLVLPVLKTILYHEGKDGFEYIMVVNDSADTVAFVKEGEPWRISGAVEFVFDPALRLETNEVIIITSFDPKDQNALSAFKKHYGFEGTKIRMVGPFEETLSNKGGRISLERPEAPDDDEDKPSWVVIDEVIYFDHEPWDYRADEPGMSLKRIDTRRSGNDPRNWSMDLPM